MVIIIAISRFLNVDDKGVLYIGKASPLLDWVINLKKSIALEYIVSSDDCVIRYKSNPNITIKFPYKNLHIELFFSENPTETEKNLIESYFKKHGEVPPLNCI